MEAAKEGNAILFVCMHSRFTAGIRSSTLCDIRTKCVSHLIFYSYLHVKATEDQAYIPGLQTNSKSQGIVQN